MHRRSTLTLSQPRLPPASELLQLEPSASPRSRSPSPTSRDESRPSSPPDSPPEPGTYSPAIAVTLVPIEAIPPPPHHGAHRSRPASATLRDQQQQRGQPLPNSSAAQGDELELNTEMAEEVYPDPVGWTNGDAFIEQLREAGTSARPYNILGTLGKGKFAMVYKAEFEGKLYAVKKVQIFDMMSTASRDKCLKEIKLLQSLDHDNIVRYEDSYIDNGTNELVIVLQWARGGDLKKLLRKVRADPNVEKQFFPEPVIWRYCAELSSGLKYMHERRVMHRDLKPANIMLTGDNHILLGDLGLSRYFTAHTLEAFSKVGTPLYISPEVLLGNGYGFSADVWSLGCILYELCTLLSPFKPATEGVNLYALFGNIRGGQYKPIPDTRYSPALREMITGMIVVDPTLRAGMSDVHGVATRALGGTMGKQMRPASATAAQRAQRAALLPAATPTTNPSTAIVPARPPSSQAQRPPSSHQTPQRSPSPSTNARPPSSSGQRAPSPSSTAALPRPLPLPTATLTLPPSTSLSSTKSAEEMKRKDGEYQQQQRIVRRGSGEHSNGGGTVPQQHDRGDETERRRRRLSANENEQQREHDEREQQERERSERRREREAEKERERERSDKERERDRHRERERERRDKEQDRERGRENGTNHNHHYEEPVAPRLPPSALHTTPASIRQTMERVASHSSLLSSPQTGARGDALPGLGPNNDRSRSPSPAPAFLPRSTSQTGYRPPSSHATAAPTTPVKASNGYVNGRSASPSTFQTPSSASSSKYATYQSPPSINTNSNAREERAPSPLRSPSFVVSGASRNANGTSHNSHNGSSARPSAPHVTSSSTTSTSSLAASLASTPATRPTRAHSADMKKDRTPTTATTNGVYANGTTSTATHTPTKVVVTPPRPSSGDTSRRVPMEEPPVDVLCEEVVDKLMALHYETQFCKRLGLPWLARTYFVSAPSRVVSRASSASRTRATSAAHVPYSQWYYFAHLTHWLLTLALPDGANNVDCEDLHHALMMRSESEPDRIAISTTICSIVLNPPLSFAFPTPVTPASLARAHGVDVVRLLTRLVDAVIARRRRGGGGASLGVGGADVIAPLAPRTYPDPPSPRDEMPVEEELVATLAEEAAHASDEDEQDTKVDPLADALALDAQRKAAARWHAECARVIEQEKLAYKFPIKGLKEYRRHVDLITKHLSLLRPATTPLTTLLTKVAAIQKQLDRVKAFEVRLNKNHSHLQSEYSSVATRHDALTAQADAQRTALASLSTQLVQVEEAVDAVKRDMDAKRELMESDEPIRKLKRALQQLKRDVALMDMQVGLKATCLFEYRNQQRSGRWRVHK